MSKVANHLSMAARKHMRRLEKDYELGPDQQLILRVGFEAWDQANTAGEILRVEGLVVKGRRHPAADIQKQATAIFLRVMRELGLNRGEPGDAGRPPMDVEL